MKKTLYDMEPRENASIEEWKEWAFRLRARAIDGEERRERAQQAATTLRRELEEQSHAFVWYKGRVADLENTIRTIKNNRAYRVAKFVLSLKGRVLQAVRAARRSFSS